MKNGRKAMSDEAVLEELLSLWQAEQARGRDVPAAVLCRQRPEMAEKLGQRIEAVRRLNALAQPNSTAPVAVPAAILVSSASLMQCLRQYPILDAAQLRELETLLPRFTEAKPLAAELVRRGWLTPYQANQLLLGRGRELVLGSYILLERLGEGGMGQVFKAKNWKLGRIVAVKLIRKERLVHPDAVRRFQREVRAAAALSHPNIVHALDADEIGGTHLLVMECVEGATDLARLVAKNGPLPVAQACVYVRQTALGLQHACERGLVHRDIKPQNLLLTGDGRTVKILDMGLARLDHPEADREKASSMTQEGAIMGTPDYIAPEQVMGAHEVDIRANLYSLGCTFYQLLTGRVPFPGGSLMQKFDGHRFQEPTPVETLRPDVSPAIAAVVRKLMAKKPAERYQTPADVAAALAGSASDSAMLVGNDRTLVEGQQAAVATAVSGDTLPSSPFAQLSAEATASSRGRNGRRWLVSVAASLAVLALGVMALRFLLSRGDNQPKEKSSDKVVEASQQSPKAAKKVEDSWLKQVAALPAEEQVKAVMSKLKERNPGFDGQETHKSEGGVATELNFLSDNVTDISPVQALAGLKILRCYGSDSGKGKLADLAPLASMKLTYLVCSNTQVADLTPLMSLPLTALECRNTPLKDFSSLKGLKLKSLNCGGTLVSDLSPLEEMKLAFLAIDGTKVSDLSPLKGMPLTTLNCTNTAVANLTPLRGMPLTEFYCNSTKVEDLSPLRGMPLWQLQCDHTKVADLAPLKGMKLTILNCGSTPVADLAPLEGMPLTQLHLNHIKVSDLSPLKGMPLTFLACADTPVKDLTPLNGMKLQHLNCGSTAVADLSPLTDMPLTSLECYNTRITDLSPLKGMKLTAFSAGDVKVTDLSPLRGMPLKILNFNQLNLERDAPILRSLTTLEEINGKPAAQFWKEVDAKKP
jgi:serine/threonine protein kinase/Leucine-rich repeat (LRR) protein